MAYGASTSLFARVLVLVVLCTFTPTDGSFAAQLTSEVAAETPYTGDVPDAIKERGAFRAAFVRAVPWAFRNRHGDYVGFEIDVAKQLARDMNVEHRAFRTAFVSIIEWERKVRANFGVLPIHMGVPGLASVTGLIKYARICTIGPSVRFLTRGLDKLVKLAKTWAPDRLLTVLSQHKAANPEFGMEKTHFYSFGELSLIAQWINAVSDGDIAFDQNGRNFSAISNSPPLLWKNSKGI